MVKEMAASATPLSRADDTAVEPRLYTIVAAVCHPDDEVIWACGLIAALSRYNFLRVFVLCLSGNDPASLRLKEFVVWVIPIPTCQSTQRLSIES